MVYDFESVAPGEEAGRAFHEENEGGVEGEVGKGPGVVERVGVGVGRLLLIEVKHVDEVLGGVGLIMMMMEVDKRALRVGMAYDDEDRRDYLSDDARGEVLALDHVVHGLGKDDDSLTKG